MPTHYRFGSVLYTEVEIRDIGFRHGQDDIRYYPPEDWGGGGRARNCILLHPVAPLEVLYQAGYREGYYSRYPKN